MIWLLMVGCMGKVKLIHKKKKMLKNNIFNKQKKCQKKYLQKNNIFKKIIFSKKIFSKKNNIFKKK